MPERLYRWRCIKDRWRAIAVLATALEMSENYLLGISTTNVPFIDVDKKDELCRKLLPSFIDWVKDLLKCRVAVLETDKGYHIVPMTTLENESRLYEKLGEEISKTYTSLLSIITRYVSSDVIRRSGLTAEDVGRRTEVWLKIRERLPTKVLGIVTGYERRLESLYFKRYQVRKLMRMGGFYIKGKPTFEEFYRTVKRIAEMRDPRFPWTVFADACIDKAHVECSIKYHRTTLRISAKKCRPYDIKFLYIK